MPFWLAAAAVFIFGAMLGSFLNVLIYRSQRGQNWVTGRSRCEHCRHQLAWYENIPLLSYFFLRGRCLNCRRSIDLIHPFVELMTGALLLWWYLLGALFFRLSSSPLVVVQPFFWLIVGLLSVAIIISDLKWMLIPRWAVNALLIFTLLYRGLLLWAGEMQWRDFGFSLIWTLALAGLFFALWWLTRGKGFGFGDVQLAVPLGLILGSWQRILVGVFLAFLIGAFVGLVLLSTGKKSWKQAVPFGPFLLLGTALSLWWGYELWEWYGRMLG